MHFICFPSIESFLNNVDVISEFVEHRVHENVQFSNKPQDISVSLLRRKDAEILPCIKWRSSNFPLNTLKVFFFTLAFLNLRNLTLWRRKPAATFQQRLCSCNTHVQMFVFPPPCRAAQDQFHLSFYCLHKYMKPIAKFNYIMQSWTTLNSSETRIKPCTCWGNQTLCNPPNAALSVPHHRFKSPNKRGSRDD